MLSTKSPNFNENMLSYSHPFLPVGSLRLYYTWNLRVHLPAQHRAPAPDSGIYSLLQSWVWMHQVLQPKNNPGVKDSVFCSFYCINFMIEEIVPHGLLTLQSPVDLLDSQKDAWTFGIYYHYWAYESMGYQWNPQSMWKRTIQQSEEKALF